jgi:hypothetical protein
MSFCRKRPEDSAAADRDIIVTIPTRRGYRDAVVAVLFPQSLWCHSNTQSMALKMILPTGQRPGEVAHMRSEIFKTVGGRCQASPSRNRAGRALKKWGKPSCMASICRADAVAADGSNRASVFWPPRQPYQKSRQGDAFILPRPWRRTRPPHDLRRTHGTTITGLGFGRDAMNRVQNHKEGGIGSAYNRHLHKKNWRTMETVAQKLMALVHGSLEHVVVTFNGTR